MKASAIRELRSDELQGKLDDLYKQLFGLRSQAMTEKVENNRAVTNVKRDIARLKTIMREIELKGQ
ncbi:MAG: 50S ribosomal protein L29 [Anaerohalosphaera sp.]|nr:50S ribosomal protein L29 [Anaerohalosphaera sp.]